ncbi:hypothetical protein [Streptomyces sp. S.PNR 29]|uniref:hypothetical protein n=1 Tax=Streptomyces sp. S.PNR 29 TaxID=2973805 RepID=UPI0025B175FB|nr:hypothetical protein [Streptomyces sp. S.PNR 29]MDN0195482.1 hypothetical protein [Streptomyces sp. S.PNR 29]
MDRSLRELGEHTAGTRDFDPRITLTPIGQATDIPEEESEAETADERCASLYDAIREMSTYGSEIEAEKRRNNASGIVPKP